jgi:uncharacterized protein
MIDGKLLAILVCPTDHSPLGAADAPLVARVNRAIAAGGVKNRAGRPVKRPIKGGLLRADNAVLYPVLDDVQENCKVDFGKRGGGLVRRNFGGGSRNSPLLV